MANTAEQGAWRVRLVQPGDIAPIAAIYNHYVLHSTCTFATEPEGAEYWNAWLMAHADRFPAVVAESGGEILAWGSLSRWNARCAYRFSAEDSVYVHPTHHHRGLGRAILSDLIDRARLIGHRNLVAQIADHQPASENLHQQLGFRKAGVLEGIGFKFERWIDVAIWQLRLEATSASPA